MAHDQQPHVEATADSNSSQPGPGVPVANGIVLPCRPLPKAMEMAMEFLKKGDGEYVPGKIDGPLAGYFTTALVNDDGSPSIRLLSFPARQHAYFISTFLLYHAYSGQQEWLTRACDLADWNLAHSTAADAFYPNLPYSAYCEGSPGGSQDGDSIEPDKAAFIASAYIALFETTGKKQYLAGAKAIAESLIRHQNKDGSWSFRVVPADGMVRQEFGGAPVFFVQFFEDILRHENDPRYEKAYDRALQLMLVRNVEQNLWGTYHEDVRPKPQDYLSAEPMSFTANYLFRHTEEHPEYLGMGQRILARMEERLVHTKGHAAAPAPAVSEQMSFAHMMPGHTARYCLALAELYKLTGDEQVRNKAISGVNSLTYMQSETGLFKTFFQRVNDNRPDYKRPNWYSQHLYTVCHVLEVMPLLDEIQMASVTMQ